MIRAVIRDFSEGDAFVKLSAILWGASCFRRRQFARGILLTLIQLVWLGSLFGFFLPYILKLPTLGTVEQVRTYDEATRQMVFNDYDNSFLILLFGVIGLAVLFGGCFGALRNIRFARQVEADARLGHSPTLKDDLHGAMNRHFHRTLLALPVGSILLFTVLPLIVMILIAFTNYDRQHLPPAKLFTWVGLDNFGQLFRSAGEGSFGYAFTQVLLWTLAWAVLATLSCYFLGILMAMLINHRSTRGKKFWRTCFMIAMAVPQFVSLLLVRDFFADLGIVNTFCKSIGLTDWLYGLGAIPTANYIPFLTHPSWARPMILLINVWVGVPYQMLIATGILMNIPGELLEAARIDGANAWQSFRAVTLPYLLFITGPSLVNSLVANINNFNVIWLLTRDVYTTSNQRLASSSASEVDLLVTWLYRLTQDQSNYKMAAVIGILVFVVCAALTLAAFTRLIRGDKEESFQ